MDITIISANQLKQTLTCDPSERVNSLKSKYASLISVPASAVRLIYSGAELKPDNAKLNELGIGKHNNWVVHAMVKVVDLSTLSEPPSNPKPSSAPIVVDLAESEDIQDISPVPARSRRVTRIKKKNSHTPSEILIDISDETSLNEQSDLSTHTEAGIMPSAKKRSQRKRKASEPIIEIDDDVKEIVTSSSSDDVEEKRAAKFKNGSYDDEQRIIRALSQRLYLLSQSEKSTTNNLERTFNVLGSTGNVYDISIKKTPTCSCPDFNRGHVCKHIIFVMVKVLRVPATSPLVYQKALLQRELSQIFAVPLTDINPSVKASEPIMSAFKKVFGQVDTDINDINKGDTDVVDDSDVLPSDVNADTTPRECPICFDNIVVSGHKAEAFDDCGVCKIRIHRECMQKWQSRGGKSICPQCRSDWKSYIVSRTTPVRYQGNYVNLR